MAAISQTIFSNAFSWMKNFVFWFQFHWSLFQRVQLTISWHCFNWWLCVEQGTSYNLKQCLLSSLRHICVTRGRWINYWNLADISFILLIIKVPNFMVVHENHIARIMVEQLLLVLQCAIQDIEHSLSEWTFCQILESVAATALDADLFTWLWILILLGIDAALSHAEFLCN